MEESKRIQQAAALTRMVAQTPGGPELDVMIASVIFNSKCEPCGVADQPNHFVGARHVFSPLHGNMLCTDPIPAYSLNYEWGEHVFGWLALNFDGVDLFKDGDGWYCNLSEIGKDGVWYRVVHTSKSPAMLEVACKAALLAHFSPQHEPLEVRKVVYGSTPRRRQVHTKVSE